MGIDALPCRINAAMPLSRSRFLNPEDVRTISLDRISVRKSILMQQELIDEKLTIADTVRVWRGSAAGRTRP